MALEDIAKQLETIGCDVEISGRTLNVSYNGNKKEIEVSKEWIKDIKSYYRSNQYQFEVSKRKLIGPKSIEIGITRLSHEFFGRPDHVFTSQNKRRVRISRSSNRFALSFFHSEEYKDFFDAILAKRFELDRDIEFDKLFWFAPTIEFTIPRKTDQSKLLAEGMPALEACLFKLAVEKGKCWDFSRKIKKRQYIFYEDQNTEEQNIPSASYDPNMLKYFKVAVSSLFPSQSFLSFYHVLEYNFLAVSDESLQGKLKSHINSTNFRGDEENLEKIVSIVKKHSSNDDETQMLLGVIRKFVDEDEFIEFVAEIEEQAEEKIYTKTHEVFGENLSISNKKGHALSNAAKLLKHVRNALVHSSDRYNRDDCHIPLTDSEVLIEKYIPLVRFLAEKVIYAKAS